MDSIKEQIKQENEKIARLEQELVASRRIKLKLETKLSQDK